MVDILSGTVEIRRGKIKREKKKETTGQKYNVRICYALLRRATIISMVMMVNGDHNNTNNKWSK